MSKMCEMCERKAVVGNSRSHSNIATKRRMNINLQSKKVDGKKMSICTNCIKTINKHKAKTA